MLSCCTVTPWIDGHVISGEGGSFRVWVTSAGQSVFRTELVSEWEPADADMDPDTLLYDVPPALLEGFHRIMDGGGDTLGWRGLGEGSVFYTPVDRKHTFRWLQSIKISSDPFNFMDNEKMMVGSLDFRQQSRVYLLSTVKKKINPQRAYHLLTVDVTLEPFD